MTYDFGFISSVRHPQTLTNTNTLYGCSYFLYPHLRYQGLCTFRRPCSLSVQLSYRRKRKRY